MGLTGGQCWAHYGDTALPGLSPGPLGWGGVTGHGVTYKSSIQSGNLAWVGSIETQEERDLGLKTHTLLC